MQLTANSRRSAIEQRREQLQRRRAAGGSIAKSYPAVEQVRLQLDFRDSQGVPPSAQVHDLFPAAPVHFEIPCPHGDCDGTLDLGTVMAKLLSDSRETANGHLRCRGTRAGPHLARQRCSLKMHYRLSARYDRPAN